MSPFIHPSNDPAWHPAVWQPIVLILAVALAISLRFSKTFRGYQFTAWIVVAVTAAMIYPARFLHVGGFDLRNPWLILVVVQLVMFGMGTQMSLRDFAGVIQSPRGVLVGVLCRFTVMPLAGFALIKLFHFEPEIAAGVILIGSCSSGLASNVMAYLAKSNLALSVTITAVTTLLAVVLTPLWMKLLAGTLVEVRLLNLMLEIIKIVLVPIGAALLHDYLKIRRRARTQNHFHFGRDRCGVAGVPRVRRLELGPNARGPGRRAWPRASADSCSARSCSGSSTISVGCATVGWTNAFRCFRWLASSISPP